MRNIIHLFEYFVLLLIVIGCSNKTATEPAEKEFLNTLWKLEAFEIDAEIIIPPKDQIYNIKFRSDSTLIGQNDCNEIGGKYEIKGMDSLRIVFLGTTEVYCGEDSFDMLFYAAIQQLSSFYLFKNKLVLYYGTNSKLILN